LRNELPRPSIRQLNRHLYQAITAVRYQATPVYGGKRHGIDSIDHGASSRSGRRSPKIPPVGLAVVFGGAAVLVGGQASPDAMSWSLPVLAVPKIGFSGPAVAAVSLPMVVLALGLGNVQGLGFLMGQGYKVPINKISILVGVNSVVNALLGGHPATVARTGVAIIAGPNAGLESQRYWGSIVAAVLTLIIALAAGLVIPILAVLPSYYIFALAGLAIFASLQDAFEKAFGNTLRLRRHHSPS